MNSKYCFIIIFSVFFLSLKSTGMTEYKEPNNPPDTDYRNQFTGYYHAIIINGYFPSEIYDTIETTMTITKFEGYSTPQCSNYEDTAHKLAMVWGDYSGPSECNSRCFYVRNFIHPTIFSNGDLHYPEFELCNNDFSGHFENDSLVIIYDIIHISYGESHFIRAKKDSTLTAIKGKDFQNRIVVFPNPANNYLSVSSDLSGKYLSAEIFDLFGKPVSEKIIFSEEDNTINISYLPKGIYFIRIYTEENVVTKKFLKE